MALIKPFKAIRPAKDKVAFVASRPYEDYDKKERNYHLKYNPFSFLHIINPGYKFQKTIKGKERFASVRNRYLEFLEAGIFVKDETEGFYLYQIQQGEFQTSGIFCATSVLDYRNDIIKKHEDTLYKRERLFANYLKAVRFNAEPVLITYPKNETIQGILTREKVKTPEYDFTTPDNKRHRLWHIKEGHILDQLQRAFSKINAVYIADGHHRSASSNMLAKEMESANGLHSDQEAYNYFLSYLIPESDIRIYAFNRLVKDLNGMDKHGFLMKLDAFFRIEQNESGLYGPRQKHSFGMYLGGDHYLLHLRKNAYEFTDALSALDTQILYKTVLGPLLGIQDLKKDKRIAYQQGGHQLLKMKEQIDAGEYAVGFSLLPITMAEIKAIADARLVMPPKSTYIAPKLRSGMAIYEI